MGDGGIDQPPLNSIHESIIIYERERERVIIKTGDILKRLGILYNIHSKYAH
jgi:hypothetical protein